MFQVPAMRLQDRVGLLHLLRLLFHRIDMFFMLPSRLHGWLSADASVPNDRNLPAALLRALRLAAISSADIASLDPGP